MRMFITGSEGMLGKEAMKYFSNCYNCQGIDFVNKQDITNKKQMEKLFKSFKPDIVLHCAALIDVKYCESHWKETEIVNIIGTRIISELCNQYKSKLVYISTSMVYDGKKYRTYSENDRAGIDTALNNYALSKLCGEDEAKKCDDHLIIRTNIFGWKPNSFGEWIYRSIQDKENINLYKDMYFNCLYVEDFCKYLYPLLLRNKTGLYNLTSRDYMSKYQFGNLMTKLLKSDYKFNSIIYNDIILRPKRAVLNCSKFENEIKMKLPTMKETMIEFLKDRGKK
jgi:dTDP-4-dehydrorhamnose reductase